MKAKADKLKLESQRRQGKSSNRNILEAQTAARQVILADGENLANGKWIGARFGRGTEEPRIAGDGRTADFADDADERKPEGAFAPHHPSFPRRRELRHRIVLV